MSVPETPTTFRVTAYCQAEKARTEELFARVVALSAASSWPSARAAFGRLARRISLHIRLAEDAFFPLFELKTGGETGLTLELVDDHRAVLRDLEELRSCLHDRRLDDLPSCVRALRDRINLHDGRELRLLCPLIDRMLSDDERAFLGSRIMAETKSCSAPPTRLGEDESGRNRGRSLERKPKR